MSGEKERAEGTARKKRQAGREREQELESKKTVKKTKTKENRPATKFARGQKLGNLLNIPAPPLPPTTQYPLRRQPSTTITELHHRFQPHPQPSASSDQPSLINQHTTKTRPITKSFSKNPTVTAAFSPNNQIVFCPFPPAGSSPLVRYTRRRPIAWHLSSAWVTLPSFRPNSAAPERSFQTYFTI